MATWEERRELGKALRTRVPRASHGQWQPAADRPSVLTLLARSNRGRQPSLIPLRLSRMAASPFDFLRGSAAIMAADLARTPASGLRVLMSGDAHLANFGLYGTPAGDVIFDLDDFDESTPGPWEWDLKRLTASINVAGRVHGLGKRDRRTAVEHAVQSYRATAARLGSLGVLEAWYQSTSLEHPGPLLAPIFGVDAVEAGLISRAVAVARTRTSLGLFAKVAESTGRGGWRFRLDPPTLTAITPTLKHGVRAAYSRYARTLSPERQALLAHYQVEDVAHRVVGVGSVGLRAYLVLLLGNGPGDPLLLQIKEATRPSAAAYLPARWGRPKGHQGERVVLAHRALQASTDLLLGWTSAAGRPYFVRQMRNMKGSIPLEWLEGRLFLTYGAACAAILARAHARVGDIAAIAGYCGNSAALDEALGDWAEAYGEQTERDHAELVKAVSGR
jgi:uncharacterized protein (DUF2252 family)